MNTSTSFWKHVKTLYVFASLLVYASCSAHAFESSPTSTSCQQRKQFFIKANGAQLFCQVIGKGEPIIVIHGGPGLSQDYLLPSMATLGENNLVIFYDQRSCGRSTGELSSESMTLETFLEDIEAIRIAFGNRKTTLLGHSWGGFLAMHYALKYPKSIEKLILVSSAPASSEEMALCEKEWSARMAPYREELKGLEESSAFTNGDPDIAEEWLKETFRLYFYDPHKTELLNWRLPPKVLVNGMKVGKILQKSCLSSYNMHESLTRLRIPTLVIHGENDPILASTAQKTHKSIPNSLYICIPQCGHFPYVETPEEFFHHISFFLKERSR